MRLLLAIPLAVTAFAQASRVAPPPAKSGCSVVTLEEATAVLGPGTVKNDTSGICIFVNKKTSLTVALTPNAQANFQTMRIMATQNDALVKDEPSIGIPAYSVVGKNGLGFSIFLLKGSWGAAIGSEAGPVKVPDLIRARMRVLAKKIASRL